MKKGKISSFLFYLKKKKKFIILLLIIIAVFSYFKLNKEKEDNRSVYTLGAVSRSAVFSSVAGSGQISSLNQADIKPQSSSSIKSIEVSVGQEVKKGDILVILDSRDLLRKVNDTYNSYLIAKNNLDLKLAGPSDEDILLAKSSYESAKNSYNNSLVSLETTKRNIEDNLRKAEQDLASAERSYQIALLQADSSTESTNQEVVSTYNSAKSSLDSAYLSLRSTIISADSILGLKFYNSNDISHYENILGARDSSSRILAYNNFYRSKEKLEEFEKKYKFKSSFDYQEIEDLLELMEEALSISKDMMSAIYNMLINTITSSDFSQSQLDSLKNSASSGESSMLSTFNNIRSAILNIEKLKLNLGTSDLSTVNSLENSKNSLENSRINLEKLKFENEKSLASAEYDVESKKMAYELAQIQYESKVSLPKEIDILSYRVQFSQAEANYVEAKENLEAAIIKSPINGQVAKINNKVGDDVSASTVILNIISHDKLAEITFNEVDIAKIKVGQKANLSFNAISDLYLTGEVVEVDSLGTTNQGVISYGVKISLDINDERIKPQMSVSADIIIGEAINVLSVTNSLIKKETSGLSYIEYFESNPNNLQEIITDELPDRKYVEVGFVGDSSSEIKSGLEEGELIVTRTTSLSTSNSINTSNNNQNSIFNLGGSSMPAGSMRMMR